MKKTFITILVTALVTSFCWYAANKALRRIDAVWLMSAVKAPGMMAFDSIEADQFAGRSEVAKAKLVALKKQWGKFYREQDECIGEGIGNIMITFGKIDTEAVSVKKVEPSTPMK